MFEKVYNRLKREARSALVLFALAAAGLCAAAIALGFVCAAAFIFALNRLGLVGACLIGAAVFLVATLILVAVYAALAARRRREELARAADARSSSALADPRLVLLGLQIVQAVGVKRLLPILALGAAAFALGSGAMRARAGARDPDPPPPG